MTPTDRTHVDVDVHLDTIIRGARLLDPDADGPDRGDLALHDVGISAGRIVAIAAELPAASTTEVIDASGLVLVPGLIDLHAHVFHPRTYLGVAADSVGVDAGVTTLVDAGSTGADDFDEFARDVIDASATQVVSFLNISRLGLVGGNHELIDLAAVGGAETDELLAREAHGRIRGIKARMSSSVVGDNGVEPLRIARSMAEAHELPIMVHVGNEPPRFADVLELLVAGDVVSHAFHGKDGGLLVDGRVSDAARDARERGVLFDIGHGSASLSFATLERALEQGFAPDIVSTDIHAQNVGGPVHDLATTISKLLAVGISLADAVRCATSAPAAVLGEHGSLGSLAVGSVADLTLLRITEPRGDELHATLTDSEGATRPATQVLHAVGTVRAGVVRSGTLHSSAVSSTSSTPTRTDAR